MPVCLANKAFSRSSPEAINRKGILTKASHEPEHIQQEGAGILGFHNEGKASQQIQEPHNPQESVVSRHDVGLLILQLADGWHEPPS